MCVCAHVIMCVATESVCTHTHCNTCHQVTKLGRGQARQPACRNMAVILKTKTKSVIAFVFDRTVHAKISACTEQYVLQSTFVFVCVSVCKCVRRCPCVYIYMYMLKINIGYITPCDPVAHLGPSLLKRGLTKQSLSLAEMLQGQLR